MSHWFFPQVSHLHWQAQTTTRQLMRSFPWDSLTKVTTIPSRDSPKTASSGNAFIRWAKLVKELWPRTETGKMPSSASHTATRLVWKVGNVLPDTREWRIKKGLKSQKLHRTFAIYVTKASTTRPTSTDIKKVTVRTSAACVKRSH